MSCFVFITAGFLCMQDGMPYLAIAHFCFALTSALFLIFEP